MAVDSVEVEVPLFCVVCGPGGRVFVAGGGGAGATGVSNHVIELAVSGRGGLKVREVVDTEDIAVMNMALAPSPQEGHLVCGMEEYAAVYALLKGGGAGDAGEGAGVSSGGRSGGSLWNSPGGAGRSGLVGSTVSGESLAWVRSVVTDRASKGARQIRCVFNATGAQLATTGEDAKLRIWAFPSMKKVHTLTGHTGVIRDMDFNLYGSQIVSVSQQDRTCKVWKVAMGRLYRSIAADTILKGYTFRACRCSKDGTSLFLGMTRNRGASYVAQLDAATGLVRELVRVHDEQMMCMAYSEDGQYLAVGTGEGNVAIVTAADFQPVVTCQVHPLMVTGMAFSHDSRFLVTVSTDRSVRCVRVHPSGGGRTFKLFIALMMVIACLYYMWLWRTAAIAPTIDSDAGNADA